MARLLEYQGKRLLAEVGIAVPRGNPVETADEAEAEAEAIGGPVVVKAQLPAGGRGLAGGIRFAATPGEAGAAAAKLLGTTLKGFQIDCVLIEEQVEIQQELYLAVYSDPARRAPVIAFTPAGGVEIERRIAHAKDSIAIAEIDIRRGAAPHVGIDLVRRFDLAPRLVAALGGIACALYDVYRRNDCLLAEINPLAVTPNGLVALDARISIDDDAVFRHPELEIERSPEVGDRLPTPLELIAARIDAHDHRGSAHFVQIDPDGSIARGLGKVSIGFDGVGTGVSLATMDELVPLGFYPRNFCDTSGNPTASKLYRITRVILTQPGIEGYVFVSCLSSQQLDNTARGIIKAFKEIYRDSALEPNIPCVFCFRGAWDETAIALFTEHGLARSRWVKLMGRDATERDVALTFKSLHQAWRAERTGRSA